MLLSIAIGVAAAGLVLIFALRAWRWELDGVRRTVAVTGASSGLGFATVQRLLAAGDHVVALDRRISKELLGLHADTQLKKPDALKVVGMDVTSESDVAAAVDAVAAWSSKSGLDAVVNFAGVVATGPLCEIDTSDFSSCLDVNVVGTWRVNKAFIGLLSKSARSRIINVSSEVGANLSAMAFNGPYSISKWAIECYSCVLRQELSMMKPPIGVISLCPGGE